MLDKIGIGIDLTKIKKFEDMPYEKNLDFYKNLFSKNEIEYCIKFKNPYEHFSGKFAIKEAVIKAIGEKIPLLSIITDHKDSQPIVKIENSSEYNFKVTVSHEEDFAMAVVISERII